MDGNRFFLYKHTTAANRQPDKYEIKEFHNSVRNPFFRNVCRKNKTREYNDFYTELRWVVASHRRLRIFYMEDEKRIIHSSFCTPKSFKFPFMNKNDYHIGPCFTDPLYRGKGLYPIVLSKIVKELKKSPECGNIYMIIEENNIASQEGVKKAGFQKTAVLYRKGRLKKYYVKEWLQA